MVLIDLINLNVVSKQIFMVQIDFEKLNSILIKGFFYFISFDKSYKRYKFLN